jgi:hypothetical protein
VLALEHRETWVLPLGAHPPTVSDMSDGSRLWSPWRIELWDRLVLVKPDANLQKEGRAR